MTTELKDIQKELLKRFWKLANKMNRIPTLEDLEFEYKQSKQKRGMSRRKIRTYFGNYTSLKNEAKKFDNESHNKITTSVTNKDNLITLSDLPKKYKNYIFTSAVPYTKVDMKKYEALQLKCKKENALLVIISCDFDIDGIDPFLIKEHKEHKCLIVLDNMPVNDKLHVEMIEIKATAENPITASLKRIGEVRGSYVFGSPKQQLEVIPTSNNNVIPHVLMTTGCITKPYYGKNKGTEKRKANKLAELDHTFGGIMVNVVDKEEFHYRQMQFDKQNRIVDMGLAYSNTKVEKMKADTVVLGDWHSSEVDPVAVNALTHMIKTLKPKRLVLHDLFDGHSISHHNERNNVTKAKIFSHQLTLKKELELLKDDLEFLTSLVDEVIVVASNHPEHLDRYIDEGRYAKDQVNFELGHALAIERFNGKNLLKVAMEKMGMKNSQKVKWLERNDDYKVHGIELSHHGDKGANGAFGSLNSYENAHLNSISGHTHTPKIVRGAWSVGTTSKLDLGYNRGGVSSWMHTACVIYDNGSRQLINVVNGKWCATCPNFIDEVEKMDTDKKNKAYYDVNGRMFTLENLMKKYDVSSTSELEKLIKKASRK